MTLESSDKYLRVVTWARKRYSTKCGLVVQIGARWSKYSLIERAAWGKYSCK